MRPLKRGVAKFTRVLRANTFGGNTANTACCDREHTTLASERSIPGMHLMNKHHYEYIIL